MVKSLLTYGREAVLFSHEGVDKGRTIRSPGSGVDSFFVQDFFLVALGLQHFLGQYWHFS